MTAEALAAVGKLPVITSVVRAFRAVLNQRRAFARVALLPGFATLTVIYTLPVLWEWMPLQRSPYAPLLALLPGTMAALPLGYLATVWLRFRLCGAPTRLLPVVPWHRPAAVIAAYCLVSFLCILAVPGVMVLYYDEYARIMRAELTLIVGLLLLLSVIYLIGRLLIAAPATAVGAAASPHAAWRLSQRHGLRLFASVALIFFSMLVLGIASMVGYTSAKWFLLILLGFVTDPFDRYTLLPHSGQVIVALTLTLGTVVLAEYLTLAYKAITGWQCNRAELLERFD